MATDTPAIRPTSPDSDSHLVPTGRTITWRAVIFVLSTAFSLWFGYGLLRELIEICYVFDRSTYVRWWSSCLILATGVVAVRVWRQSKPSSDAMLRTWLLRSASAGVAVLSFTVTLILPLYDLDANDRLCQAYLLPPYIMWLAGTYNNCFALHSLWKLLHGCYLHYFRYWPDR